MGAWGVLAFDNDEANDWAYDLEDTRDLSLIESAFAAVDDATEYLDAHDACNALAACEILARLKGKPGYQNAYTEKVDEWVKNHPMEPSQELLDHASKIIDRVLGKHSELRELWEEGDASEWLAAVEDLRQRLR